MKKISVLAALMLALMLTGSAWADIVEVSNPGDQFWDSTSGAIAAKARNGAPPDSTDVVGTYAIGLGYTDLSTPPPDGLLKLAIGDGFWSYGSQYQYHFTLEYEWRETPQSPLLTKFSITGLLDGKYQTYYEAYQLNEYAGIYTIRLNYTGNVNDGKVCGVVISNLKLDTTLMGDGDNPSGTYESGSSDKFVYFRNLDGTPFTRDFTISGDFVFTGDGGGANFPGFEIDLSPQPVPLPPSALLLGTGLLGLAWRRFRKG